MEPMLGSIVLVPYQYVPSIALPCDGRSLLITAHQTLFVLLGTRFGGDGVTTFRIPDLRSLTPVGMMYAIYTVGPFPSRS